VSIRAHRHYEGRPASQRPPVNVHCGWQLRTPGWIRTSGFDTRNVALFPLSYEGMLRTRTWTVGESNPAHQACKARLCTSTQPMTRHTRTLAGTRTRTVGVLNTAPLPLGHEGMNKSGSRGSNPRSLVGSQALYH
jgi:hypothetical protein